MTFPKKIKNKTLTKQSVEFSIGKSDQGELKPQQKVSHGIH